MMSRFSEISDEALLAATRSGETDAFAAFFARHSEFVLRFVRRRVGSAELAADLTAEVFAAALLAAHRGRAQSMPDGRVWLRAIARNKIVDSYRRGRAERRALTQLGLERPPLEQVDLEAIDRLGGAGSPVHAALTQLRKEELQAVLERVVLERDYEQLAGGAGISRATARKRVSRGLARLRKEMGFDAK